MVLQLGATATPHQSSHSPVGILCPNVQCAHPGWANRSSLALWRWQQRMPWLGRSLFHLAWLAETLSPSKMLSAAPLRPPLPVPNTPRPSELSSWEPITGRGKSLLVLVL